MDNTNTTPLLCHYTDIEGLKGILNSEKLWFSDSRFMDDTSEYNFLNELASTLNSAINLENFYSFMSFLRTTYPLFLCSFTSTHINTPDYRDGNLLVARYFGEKAWVGIRFKSEGIDEALENFTSLNNSKTVTTFINNVHYRDQFDPIDSPDPIELISSALEWTYDEDLSCALHRNSEKLSSQQIKNLAKDFINACINAKKAEDCPFPYNEPYFKNLNIIPLFLLALAIFKHSGFKGENEIRAGLIISTSDFLDKIQNSLVRPRIEVPIDLSCIDSILISRGAHEEQYKAIINNILLKHEFFKGKHDFSNFIRVSSIPWRNKSR